jgi:transcriptional regulator with XRE-family HTH domain
MDSWELRAIRRTSGLTLRAVADAAGTSETNVSAYERGAKTPSAATLQRLLDVIAVGGSSPIHRQSLMTVPAAAAAMRAGLRRNASAAELLRIVREMRSHGGLISSAADQRAFFARPSTTGDQRWDLLLAGVVEDFALTHGWDPPRWTRKQPLPKFWFVGGGSAMSAYAFAHSPMSLQVRGVLLDPADLEAV